MGWNNESQALFHESGGHTMYYTKQYQSKQTLTLGWNSETNWEPKVNWFDNNPAAQLLFREELHLKYKV